MIEDKKLGLKIAESKEEELWEKVREAREATIKGLKDSLIIEEAFLKLAEEKLKGLAKK